MKLPTRRYRIALLCALLALSGLTIYAHRMLESTRRAASLSAALGQHVGVNTARKPTKAAELAASQPIETAFEPVQSGGSYNLTQAVLPGGGGTSTGGSNELTGTAGQSTLGASSAGSYSISGGFWGGTASGGCTTITISPATLPGGTVGTSYNQTLLASGGGAPYTFTLTAGALPGGLSLSSAGVLSGLPNAGGTFNFTITATDAGSCTGTQAYALTINTLPAISTVATTRQQGSALSNSSIANVNDADQTASTLAVTVNGGTTATVNGVAVSGLSINAAGVVSANVSAACTATNANFTLTVTDNAAASVNATLNITVTANSAPSLSYGNQAVSAGGALNVSPASAIDNGSITGFALVSVTPALITAPTVTGAGVVVITNAAPATIHTLIIRATDNCGATTDASFTLNVGCPTITVNPASLPGGTTGAVYPNQTFMASGGVAPYSFSVSMGALPNGLTLSGAGVLAGTPTTAGLFNFTITATDANICLSAHTYPLTINQAVLAKAKKADFDGDGKTDLSIFSPSAAPPLTNWSVINSSNGLTVTQQWGAGYAPYFDDIVPGDYDGDGKADHAIWRGADSIWYIRKSSDGQAILQFWGANYAPYFDIPTPGDYDGDGKTDIAVFRRSGTWFVRRSSDGQNMIVTHGQQDDIPVPADYDGDGKTDLAVFRPGAIAPAPNWIILNSSTNTVTSIQWGAGYAPYFDTPVPADYDGDGKADLAIWRGADSIWYIRKSSDGLPILDLWGANYAPYFDIPTPGDYDGDGKADIAVWRRSGTWFVKRSSNGSFLIQNQGQSGDVPVPAYGVR